MKILSWNIQHGGGTCGPRIVEGIIAHDPDIIALSEFRTKPGAAICRALSDAGWAHIELTDPTGNDNGLARLHAPFDHPDWIFELKYDGFRAVAHVENGRARLVSRKGNVYKSFPALTAAVASLPVRDAVLDGEIVYLGPDGCPQFYDLMRRRAPQQFCGFDLLWLNGRDLRGLPLLERKGLLRQVVPPQPSALMYVDHVARNGTALFDAICGRDLEGVVAKHAAGLYRPEETTWVKIKNPAYSQAEGWAEFFEGRAFHR